MKNTIIPAVTVLLLTQMGEVFAARIGLCGFDKTTLSFQGSVAEQTSCLLRFVRKKGAGSDVQTIPSVIADRVTKPTNITTTQLSECLTNLKVNAADVGGALVANKATAKRKYFVIHDTSSPELVAPASFPSNINEASWSGNDIARGWNKLFSRVNVLINRVGVSRTMTDISASRSEPAVKLENNSQVRASRQLFVHVENIQPRIRPVGSWGHLAPNPGFSEAQLYRLALVYVVASVRAGHWLIPAFHFNIDSDLYRGVDVHDDPQGFDLAKWGAKIEAVIERCNQ